MSETARALGIAAEDGINYKGIFYPMVPMGIAVRAHYEVWFEGQAVFKWKRQAKQFEENEYKKSLSLLQQEIASGTYAFYSEASTTSMQNAEGLARLIYLRLKPGNADLKPEFIFDAVVSDQSFMQEAVACMNRIDVDPLAPAPDLRPAQP